MHLLDFMDGEVCSICICSLSFVMISSWYGMVYDAMGVFLT